LYSVILFGAANPVVDTRVPPSHKNGYEGFWPSSRIVFDKGYVVRWDDPDYFKNSLYGPDGQRMYEIAFNAPDSTRTEILSTAVDTDGVLAVAYEARGKHSAGGIALLDHAGKVIRFIQTGEYVPSQVCFAPDHSIWMYGQVWPRVERDYLVFRKYSRDGQQLGAFQPRSALPAWEGAGIDMLTGPLLGGAELLASKDRIGAVLRTGGQKLVWMELDFAGNRQGQWEIDSMKWSPRVFTAGGALYGTKWEDHVIAGTALFDKASQTWERVRGVPENISPLGSDGEELIYRVQTDPPLNYLGWFLPVREVAQR
jgi:hypothetical protein